LFKIKNQALITKNIYDLPVPCSGHNSHPAENPLPPVQQQLVLLIEVVLGLVQTWRPCIPITYTENIKYLVPSVAYRSIVKFSDYGESFTEALATHLSSRVEKTAVYIGY